jgi:hypothetical protein
MQQPAGEPTGHTHLLMRERGLCQSESNKRNHQTWENTSGHDSTVSCHVVASTRNRRPKNQNIDTEPIA